jgi:hypothetical protein
MNSNTAGRDAQRYRTQIACKHAHGDAADPRSTPCHCVEIEAPAGSDIVRPANPGFTSVYHGPSNPRRWTRNILAWPLANVLEGQDKQRLPCSRVLAVWLDTPTGCAGQVKWLQCSGLRTVTSRLKTVRRFFLARAMPSMI